MSAWDFIGKDLNEYTHGLHLYPAKLNPHIVRRLIKQYGNEAENLLDPFCGSGTTLIEARLAGLDAVGLDVNPTARLLAKVKSQNHVLDGLRLFVKRLESSLDSMNLINIDDAIKRSGFTEEKIRTWFPNQTIQEIASIIELIDTIDKDTHFEDNRDFARVALSGCLRKVSIQRMNEWKIYRLENWKNIDIDELYQPLIPLFKQKLVVNLESVCDYIESLKNYGYYSSTSSVIHRIDSVNNKSIPNIPSIGFDIVITSPPYGDSPTTVAYEQFSWLTNVWLGFDTRSPGQLAKEMMGGSRVKNIEKLGCREIDSSLSKMEPKFAELNYSFYLDYLKSIENVSSMVKKGGYVCYIVGNRTSGGQNLRLDLFTRWAFEQNGFKRIGNIKKRVIPNTRMPAVIAISGKNISKIKVSTMNNEYIIVCQKMAS